MNNYHHLSLEDREKIFGWRNKNVSLREISKRLRRSPSSISRELKRNASGNGKRSREYLTFRYLPCKAEEKSNRRAIKQRTKAPLKCPFIFIYVREHLRAPYFWSPEEIAGRLSQDHPEYKISPETIYRYIYGKKARGMRLWIHLKLHRKRRMKHNGRKVKSTGRLPTALPIETRPERANKRTEEGHWETDNMGTIKTDKTAVSVTVERKCRVIRLSKLSNLKASTKRRVLTARMKQENQKFQKTMTIDRGPENSEHEEFTKETQMPVYACNPYHSWEKGSIENSIGRLRYFIPKGTSIDKITQEDLSVIEGIMNNTPRKCLGFLTPNEVYERILNGSYTS